MKDATFLGRPVRTLQTMLRKISARCPEIPPLIPDGIYGTDTMRAVTALQRYAGLPATGVADLATWNAALSMAREISEQTPGFAMGEESLRLYPLQAMLAALGQVVDDLPPVEPNGVYDEACAEAVRRMQEVSGLPVTGELDGKTSESIAGLYRLAVRRTEWEKHVGIS